MKLNSHKSTVTFALSVAMLLVIVASAFAGTAYSSYHYFTDGSYGYRNRATVETNSSGARAITYVGANPEATRPTGWYGNLARLYNSAGTLKLQDGYVYNGIPCTGSSNSTAYYKVRGTYYSYGISRSWDGSGYVGHATFTSPNQNY